MSICGDSKLYRQLVEFYWREREVSYGRENEDKVFYVIRRHASQAGLFSFVCTNIGAVYEAQQKGYIPVIDMMNSVNPMLKQEQIGKINAWDIFFEQPCGYQLTDIRKSKHVILGTIHPPKDFPEYNMLKSEIELRKWQKVAQQYLHVKKEYTDRADQFYESVFQKERVLGVLARGTDYIAQKPENHPIQPQLNDLIQRCEKVMRDEDCRYIYLATEDEKIWNRFHEKFPGCVFSFQKKHFITDEDQNINDLGNTYMDPLQRNEEYLTSIQILSMCNCLVAGAAGGSIGALLLTKGYEYQYIYQLGRY